MYCKTKSLTMLRLILALVLVLGAEGARKRRGRPNTARIMQRPDDVPIVKCGDEIKLTCMSEGDPVPDVEWWFFEKQNVDNKTTVTHSSRDGRVKIKVEEFKVIRSTLIIKDAEESDEGMYQCRASNSQFRDNQSRKINTNQHWTIEQTPVSKVLCKDKVTTTTQVYTTADNNRVDFDDVIESTMASLTSSTTSPKSKLPDAKKKEEKSVSEDVMSSNSKKMTSPPTKIPKSNPLKPMKPAKPSEKTKKNPLKRDSRNNMVKKATPKTAIKLPENNEQEGARVSTTIASTGGAQVTCRSSWLVFLLHLPVVSFVLTTSSI